jgi:DNA phosphorothioation system restriction enzyme
MNNQGQGILNMATGTGKTITSLIATAELANLQDGHLAVIVAAPYQHLVDQWVEEIRNFGVEPIRAYQSRHSWTDDVTSTITEFKTHARDVLPIVTTHHTFATDHFQNVIERVDGSQALLIVDEVHHMGAPHLRESLTPRIRARLGLSATPERWYDEEGTNALESYFTNGIVFEYGLTEAIENGYLCEYYYVPHIVHLTDEETEDYLALSRAIGNLAAKASGDIGDADQQANEELKQLLFKRARLIGAAENKLHKLRSLIEQTGVDDIHHTLVYCGDGQVGQEGDKTKRQLRAVTELLGRDLGIKLHQFTYEEDQETRERLLRDFEEETIDALVAIRCLDEGVDVPATRTAFILASSTNPRQFIQRRGRILRTHPGKRNAVIHDFIVAPPAAVRADAKEDSEFNMERSLIQKELKRVSMFAENAKNHPDAALSSIPTSSESIAELKKDFNLLDI